MPASGPVETFDPSWDSLVDRLVAGRDAARMRLPELRAETGWLERLGTAARKHLGEWLERMFPGQAANIRGELKTVLLTTAIGIFIALALGLIFLSVQAVRRRRRQSKAGEAGVGPLSAAPPPPPPTAAELLAEARSRRDFAAAARLRWKLYLARARLARDLTPAESQPWGRDYYPLMFGRPDAEGDRGAACFDELDRALERLESEARP